MRLVRTIEDDDDVAVATRQAADAEEEEDDVLDKSFSFDERSQVEHSWDLSAARKSTLPLAVRLVDAPMIDADWPQDWQTTIDQKIQRKLDLKKATLKGCMGSTNGLAEANRRPKSPSRTSQCALLAPVLTSRAQSEARNPQQLADKSKHSKKVSKDEEDGFLLDEGEDDVHEDVVVDILRKKPAAIEEDLSHVTFADLHLSRPLLKAISSLGFDHPTPIQRRCIPLALAGHDICASAVTGSGKTGAFALPLLERLLYRPRRVAASRVLIITPTRELAVQCEAMVTKLAKFTDVRTATIVGGLSMKIQESQLRERPDIIIGTPGRLIDHLRNSMAVSFENIEILILDEADRLLDMGFKDEVEQLIKACPVDRQTLFFTATMSPAVENLAKTSTKESKFIHTNPLYSLADKLNQEFIRVRSTHEADREAMLLTLCGRLFRSKVVVFFCSKKSAHRVKLIFGLLGLSAAELHGNLTQNQRLEALELFRDQKVDFLLATDLAARGLDVLGIETVINFEMPRVLAQYVHRVGRTARAGNAGRSVSFIGESDRKLLKEVIKSGKGALKQRRLPIEEICEWRKKIESVEYDIKDLQRQEKEERMIRLAEMEANRIDNELKHSTEIAQRPKKTWFQSMAQKKVAQAESQLAVTGIPKVKNEKLKKKSKDQDDNASKRGNAKRAPKRPRDAKSSSKQPKAKRARK